MSTSPRTSRDTWWRTAPVMAIAVLALIISTAGGAYAVAKNSIGTKQLKNNAVTSGKIKSGTIQSSDLKDGSVSGADVKNGSLTAADLAPGTIPAPPAKGTTTYFAKVSSLGAVSAKSDGVSSATRLGTGSYAVNMDFDAVKCAVVSSATSSFATSSASATSPTVFVAIRDVNLTNQPLVDGSFSLIVTC